MRLKWYKKKLMQKIKKTLYNQNKTWYIRYNKKVKKDLYQHVKDNDYEKIKGSYQELEKLL